MLVHHSKSTKPRIPADHDKVQLQGKVHNTESYIFGVLHLFNLNFLSRMMAPDTRELVSHVVHLLKLFATELLFSTDIEEYAKSLE